MNSIGQFLIPFVTAACRSGLLSQQYSAPVIPADNAVTLLPAASDNTPAAGETAVKSRVVPNVDCSDRAVNTAASAVIS